MTTQPQNISIDHVLDKDFLYSMSAKDDATYITSGPDNSVVLNLGLLGSNRDTIEEALAEDGWDADTLPGLMELMLELVDKNILLIAFSEHFPKIPWLEWYTRDTFMNVKPLAYGSPLYSLNDLRDDNLAQARRLQRRAGDRIDAVAMYFIVDNQVFSIEDIEIFNLTDPEEISHDYEGYIQASDKLTIAVKILDGKVNVSQIMY